MAMHRVEAEREVEALEQDAGTLWRAAGAVPGQRSRFVDEALRERLVEALAQLAALDQSELREAISGQAAEIAKLDQKHVIGEGLENKIRAAAETDPEKWPERAAGLIDALAERAADQREEIERLKAEREGASDVPTPPPSNVRLLRPGLRKAKPRLGSTTLALPWLEVERVEVRDVPPTPIGKVEGVADPGKVKKQRGRPKKAAK